MTIEVEEITHFACGLYKGVESISFAVKYITKY